MSHGKDLSLARALFIAATVVGILSLAAFIVSADGDGTEANPIRFATFNASLYRNAAGGLVRDLKWGNLQAKVIAEIIQRVRPDVLVVDEFDYDEDAEAAELFRTNFLNVGQKGAEPIDYPYFYIGAINNGVPSGFDLNRNGQLNDPEDALGFGFFEGQYGAVVYSMYPIQDDDVRTFRTFLWKDMPDALLPKHPGTNRDWFSVEELAILPLASKTLWDIPIVVGDQIIHVLASHPTPPVFDGAEDRNGRRNHDMIRFWADYVAPGASDYIYDDGGVFGGLAPGSHFMIMGDQNADPFDGDSTNDAILQLLDSPLINTSVTPASEGGAEQARLQGGINSSHKGDPRHDTGDWNDSNPGNLRADYVLPSMTLDIIDAGVFWPLSTDPLFRLVGTAPFPGSDHRLVWMDVAFAEEP